MRRYDDPVEVRRGMVSGSEGPEQFLWRGRLWKVGQVVAHWVETGPWWQSRGAHAVLGSDAPETGGVGVGGGGGADAGAIGTDGAFDGGTVAVLGTDLGSMVAEREVWRVEAGRGSAGLGRGVFDLVLDWTDGSWRLARCLD